MKECTAGPFTLVVVWLSFCIATGSCAGQDPGSLAANPSQGSLPTSGPASPSLPVLDSLSTQDSRKITSLPPSSVSPEIESFMRRNGGRLASPKASEFTRSLPAIDSRPLPPPSLPPSTPTRVDRVMRPISRQVPSSLPPTPGTRGPGGRLLTMGPSPLSLALQLKPARLANHRTSTFPSIWPPPCGLPMPAADRGRGAGKRLGGRGSTHACQGALGALGYHGGGLYSPRRWRPGHQQGRHDRRERQFLLRRSRLVAVRQPD